MLSLLVVVWVGAVLYIWPLVETIVRQLWGWTVGVVVLGPIGGILWFAIGRRETRVETRETALNRPS